MAEGGQFNLATGGQFAWILQLIGISSTHKNIYRTVVIGIILLVFLEFYLFFGKKYY